MAPGERPPPPAVMVPAPVYADRLRRINDERFVRRAEERRDVRAWEASERSANWRIAARWQRCGVSTSWAGPECRAELELHAERVARLHRIKWTLPKNSTPPRCSSTRAEC